MVVVAISTMQRHKLNGFIFNSNESVRILAAADGRSFGGWYATVLFREMLHWAMRKRFGTGAREIHSVDGKARKRGEGRETMIGEENDLPVDRCIREALELLKPRVCGRGVPFDNDAGFAVMDQKFDPVDPGHEGRALGSLDAFIQQPIQEGL